MNHLGDSRKPSGAPNGNFCIMPVVTSCASLLS